MRICLDRMGLFIKRKNEKDNRIVEYYINNKGNYNWIKKGDLKKYIQSGKVENAQLQSDNIVFFSVENHLESINESNYLNVVKFADYENNLATEFSDYPNYLLEEIIKQYNEEKRFNSKRLKSILVAMRGNRILGLYTYKNKSNYIEIFESYFVWSNNNKEYELYKKYKKEFVFLISKKIKNSVFYFGDSDIGYLRDSSLKFLNRKCSFSPDKEYCYYSGIYMTEYNENVFVEDIEKTLFPEITMKDIKIELCGKKELENYFEKYQNMNKEWQYYWRKKSNSTAAIGYTYFDSSDVRESKDDCLFLVAYAKGIIIGVLKLSLWDGIRFIEYADISEKYWNMGILSLLVSNIDKLVPIEKYLITTMESRMGAKIHISDLIKRLVKSRKVLTRDEYDDLRYKRYREEEKSGV